MDISAIFASGEENFLIWNDIANFVIWTDVTHFVTWNDGTEFVNWTELNLSTRCDLNWISKFVIWTDEANFIISIDDANNSEKIAWSSQYVRTVISKRYEEVWLLRWVVSKSKLGVFVTFYWEVRFSVLVMIWEVFSRLPCSFEYKSCVLFSWMRLKSYEIIGKNIWS